MAGRGARGEAGGLTIGIRFLVCLGLGSCIYLSATQAAAEFHFRQNTVEGLRAALKWNSTEPRYCAALARTLRLSVGEGSTEEIVALARNAARLGPHNAHFWAELGGVHEWLGNVDEARAALERARDLFPDSPDINWKLGNFYLRNHRTREGLRALQKTIQADPELRWPAFDLALRASDDVPFILEQMIPANAEILGQFLRHLVATQRTAGAEVVWSRLAGMGARIDPMLVFPFFEELIQTQQTEKLASAWAALAGSDPGRFRQSPLYANALVNGDFEGEILNGGLDWRVMPAEGASETQDSLIFFDGASSLRIEFDGTRNLNYEQVFQFVPVIPDSVYRFAGYIRTQDITTDSGIRFQVYDAYEPSRLLRVTEGVAGTTGWSPQMLEFKTGAETRLLVVRVVRRPSRKVDNRIKGTAWIDRVSLNLAG